MSKKSSAFTPVDANHSVLREILAQVKEWSGCDFTRYNLGTMSRRVARRMIDLRCKSLEEYYRFLSMHPEEYPRLMSALTIKVSRFFRDREVFHALANTVIPRIFELRRASGRHIFRAWSAACARGEEAYSLAILILEYLASLPEDEPTWAITILGTDIDEDALGDARQALYSIGDLEHLPPEWRSRYFTRKQGPTATLWQVKPALREITSFLNFDLTSTDVLTPPSLIYAEYDLILCRNILIYCQRDLKDQILRRLYSSLTPNGYLVLGSSENLPPDITCRLVPLDKRLKIYRKEGTNP